jgi:hypothetical protein
MTLEFSPGQLYFMVQYIDPDLLVPVVQSVIFIGKNVDGEGEDLWYFQDVESHSTLGEYPNAEVGPGDIFVLPEEGLSSIVVLDAVVKDLSECLDRRKARRL